MALQFHPPSKYLLPKAIRQAKRAGYEIVPTVCISVDRFDNDKWDQSLNWLSGQSFKCFTWSPFSTEWRRYFAFEDANDLMLFKLTFMGY
jgi:hypothetical protein